MSAKVVAGDFKNGSLVSVMFGEVILNSGWSESLKLNDKIQSVELVTEENKKKFTGAAGWGIVGGALLGPAGFLAGVLLGGKKKEICFACHLKDGRKFLATDKDTKVYKKLLELSF